MTNSIASGEAGEETEKADEYKGWAVLGKLVSRKLIVVTLAIVGNVSLVLGLALIDTKLLTEAKEVILLVVVAITGLGGYQVTKQAEIDRTSEETKQVTKQAEIDRTAKNAPDPDAPDPDAPDPNTP